MLNFKHNESITKAPLFCQKKRRVEKIKANCKNMLTQEKQAVKPDTVKCVWQLVEVTNPLWEMGARDAYGARKMIRTDSSYVAGYLAQAECLPVNEKGVIEWFRYRPDGGWKLTDNI